MLASGKCCKTRGKCYHCEPRQPALPRRRRRRARGQFLLTTNPCGSFERASQTVSRPPTFIFGGKSDFIAQRTGGLSGEFDPRLRWTEYTAIEFDVTDGILLWFLILLGQEKGNQPT